MRLFVSSSVLTLRSGHLPLFGKAILRIKNPVVDYNNHGLIIIFKKIIRNRNGDIYYTKEYHSL